MEYPDKIICGDGEGAKAKVVEYVREDVVEKKLAHVKMEATKNIRAVYERYIADVVIADDLWEAIKEDGINAGWIKKGEGDEWNILTK